MVLVIALLVGQFAFTSHAHALSAKSHAHCHGQIRDSSGNVTITSLDGTQGYVSDYYAVFPQNSSHQGQCDADVSSAASTWLADKGQMCHAFFQVNGGGLVFWSYVGTHPYRDTGTATQGSQYSYPAACFAPTGHVFPSYYIFTLIYAPPGCTSDSSYDCGTGNSVEYSSGSTNGSTTSIEKSIAANTDIKANIELINTGGSFEQTTTDSKDITTKKVSTHTIKYPDSGSVGNDGINHDLDIFYLLVNPSVAIGGWHDPVTGQNHAQWSLGTKGGASARVQKVQVSYLRCALAGVGPRPGGAGNGGPNYDPTGSCSDPSTHLLMPGQPDEDASGPNGYLPGLTYEDYRQILSQDPFWNETPAQPTPIPAGRFEKEPYDFAYDPPGGFNGSSCPLQTQAIDNSRTETLSSSTDNSFTASLGFGSDEILGLTQTITYSNKVTNSKETEKTQNASVSVGCAGSSWTGEAKGHYYVGTYYDALYGTFLFTLENASGQRMLHGVVTDADGDTVPHQLVKLTIGNASYQTFTRANGTFLFNAASGQIGTSGAGTLVVGAVATSGQGVQTGPNATASPVIPTQPPTLVVKLSGPPPAPPNPSNRPSPAVANAKIVDGAAQTTTATSVHPTVSTAIAKAESQTASSVVLGVAKRDAGTVAARPTPVAPLPLYVAVENHSVFARAKNVMVTSIQASDASGAPLPYTGPLPFVVPGGVALLAGRSSIFQLPFAPGSVANLTLTVKADNLPASSKVLMHSNVVDVGQSTAQQ